MKNQTQTLNAWCMYDWANSVHSLTIVSAVFPAFFYGVAKNAEGKPEVDFMGMTVNSSALFSFAVSFAFLFIALINPFLGAIADYSGRKKQFMQFFVYLGSLSCLGLYFFNLQNIEWGMLAFSLSLIGWCGSIVFYNAYLPEIATEDRFDKLSAKGFILGYTGSVLLLIFNLAMLTKPDWFGNISTARACQVSFVTVAIWWAGFAQIPFRYLPNGKPQIDSAQKNWIWNGFKELKKVLAELQNLPTIKRFLMAFFCYNLGVQTVMYIGPLFGKDEIKLQDDALIIVILLLQLVAILGAYIFANVSGKIGNTKTILIILSVWIVVCISAYFTKTQTQFYGLAAGIGFVMGGVQSLSRSTYAKLLPQNTHDTASYFSFYDFCDKISTFFGTALFGIITQYSGMRNSILVIVLFFVAGILLLRKIPSQKIYKIEVVNQ